MKSIEKIDRSKSYTTDDILTVILDKVNELVDAHNLSVVEKDTLDINIEIDGDMLKNAIIKNINKGW